MMADPKPTIEVHPAAAIFPMLPDEEMKELAQSILSHGLREKIGVLKIKKDEKTVVQILDGRNRYEALRRIGVSDDKILAEFTVLVHPAQFGATAEEYVMMANIERRMLTAPQRKSLAGKLAIMISKAQEGLPKSMQKDATAEAAKKAGVSKRTAAAAKAEAVQVAAGILPKPTPTKTKKSAGKPGVTPATMVLKLQEFMDTVNRSGHNFPIPPLKEIQSLCKTIIELAQAKIDFIEKKQAEAEAEKAAREAAESA